MVCFGSRRLAGSRRVPPRPAPNPLATGGRGGTPPGGPDRYDHSRTYTIVDAGKWTVKKHRDFVEFTQELTDAADGYGYIYQKTVRLVAGKPQMVIEHRLKNTGKNPNQEHSVQP